MFHAKNQLLRCLVPGEILSVLCLVTIASLRKRNVCETHDWSYTNAADTVRSMIQVSNVKVIQTEAAW